MEKLSNEVVFLKRNTMHINTYRYSLNMICDLYGKEIHVGLMYEKAQIHKKNKMTKIL